MLRVEYLSLDRAGDRVAAERASLLGVLGFPAVPAGVASGLPAACVAAARLVPGASPAGLCEVWLAGEAVQQGVDGAIRFAVAGDCLFGLVAFPEGAGALQDLAQRAYAEIFALLARKGFPHAIRFWNYFPHINALEGGEERYRRFNRGRGAAFDAAGRPSTGNIPAACALGTDAGDALTVYFVAARTPGLALENPRQVSAYRYPPEYGVRSPTFSRAILHPAEDPDMLYVSGTASIVGHRTLHAGDAVAQARETLANLEAVFAEAARVSRPGAFAMPAASYKVYVRHEADAPLVRRELARALGEDADLNLLRADICRADLLLEVEAVAWAGDAAARGAP